MTLQEFFNMLGNNPNMIIAYFGLIPLTAIIAGIMGKGEGHISPWKYLYSTLLYLVSVPAIFAITLSVYFFFFERRSILDTDVYTQILPVLSMFATFLIIRRNVALDRVPGFGRISGLVMMIFVTMVFMWILDKTRIFAITFIPFQYVILMFVVFFVIFRYGMSNLLKSEKE